MLSISVVSTAIGTHPVRTLNAMLGVRLLCLAKQSLLTLIIRCYTKYSYSRQTMAQTLIEGVTRYWCRTQGIHYQDLTIRIKPLSYRQQTDYNMQIYDLQKQVRQANDLTDDDEKQKILNALWETLAKLQLEVNANSVDAIETPSATVTERGFILEFLANADKELINAINKHIDHTRSKWEIPKFPVVCTNEECKAESMLSIELDSSTFFA